jgi:hypothetical protein
VRAGSEREHELICGFLDDVHVYSQTALGPLLLKGLHSAGHFGLAVFQFKSSIVERRLYIDSLQEVGCERW